MDRQVLTIETPAAAGEAPGTRKRVAPCRARTTPSGATRGAVSPQYGAVSRILRDILRSAAEVLDAAQAFVLISRDEQPPETVATLRLRPARVLELALRGAARPIRSSLQQHRVCAADPDGEEMALCDGTLGSESNPATVCLPLDPNSHLCGVLCVIRRQNARGVSALDLEIVQALAEQVALVVGAASHRRALSRLEASLCEQIVHN